VEEEYVRRFVSAYAFVIDRWFSIASFWADKASRTWERAGDGLRGFKSAMSGEEKPVDGNKSEESSKVG
jgi:hypothetical protein